MGGQECPPMADKNVCPTIIETWMSDEVSEQALPSPLAVPAAAPAPGASAPAKSFVHHARIISVLTLGSRILGVIRESLAARFLGAGLAMDAFTLAFAMPNLFRRLFGEG